MLWASLSKSDSGHFSQIGNFRPWYQPLIIDIRSGLLASSRGVSHEPPGGVCALHRVGEFRSFVITTGKRQADRGADRGGARFARLETEPLGGGDQRIEANDPAHERGERNKQKAWSRPWRLSTARWRRRASCSWPTVNSVPAAPGAPARTGRDLTALPILLFDRESDHPPIPTCDPENPARSGSQGWPQATAEGGLALRAARTGLAWGAADGAGERPFQARGSRFLTAAQPIGHASRDTGVTPTPTSPEKIRSDAGVAGSPRSASPSAGSPCVRTRRRGCLPGKAVRAGLRRR